MQKKAENANSAEISLSTIRKQKILQQLKNLKFPTTTLKEFNTCFDIDNTWNMPLLGKTKLQNEEGWFIGESVESKKLTFLVLQKGEIHISRFDKEGFQATLIASEPQEIPAEIIDTVVDHAKCSKEELLAIIKITKFESTARRAINRLARYNTELLEDETTKTSLAKYFSEKPKVFTEKIINNIDLFEQEKNWETVYSIQSLLHNQIDPAFISQQKEQLVQLDTKIKILEENFSKCESIVDKDAKTEVTATYKNIMNTLQEQKKSIENSLKSFDGIENKTFIARKEFIFNFMLLIIDILKNKEWLLDGDTDLINCSQILYKRIGSYLFNNANNLDDPLVATRLALLCFSLGGTNANDEFHYRQKLGCYKLIFNVTGETKDFSMEKELCSDTEKYKSNLESILNDEYFNESIKCAYLNDNYHAALEWIVLNHLLSQAYSKLSLDEKANSHLYESKSLLLDFLSIQNDKIVAFAKRFVDDLEILVKVAKIEFQAKNPVEAKRILDIAIQLHTNQKDPIKDDVLFKFASLLLFTSPVSNDNELGKNLFLQSVKQGINILTVGIMKYFDKSNHQNKLLLTAELFIEAGSIDEKASEQYLSKANDLMTEAMKKWSKDPAINFAYYLAQYRHLGQLNLKNLIAAVEGGHERALIEMLRLADEYEGNGEIFEYTGLLYLAGKEVEKNYDLAAYYFLKSKSNLSVLTLSKMLLNGDIHDDSVNPIKILKAIAEVKEQSFIADFIEITKEFSKIEAYQSEAILTLIQLYISQIEVNNNDKVLVELAKNIEIYFTSFPNELFNLLPIFKNTEVLKRLDGQVLRLMFLKVYNDLDVRNVLEENFKSLSEIFIKSDVLSTRLLAITCPELRKHLSEDDVIKMLDFSSSLLDANQLASIFTSLIIERTMNKPLFAWLHAHPTVLVSLSKNIDLISQLQENSGWQSFLKKPEIIKILNNELPHLKNNEQKSSLFSSLVNLPGFFNNQPSLRAKLLVEAKANYINEKKHLFDLLCDREAELKDTNSDRLNFIHSMKKLINTIDSREKFENFKKELCASDSFFAQHYNDNSNNNLKN